MITRRDFIATTAVAGAVATLPTPTPAALPASTVGVFAPAGAAVPVPIPWRLFIDGIDHLPSTRYFLSTPFVRAGHLYATDSKICIRATTSRPDTKPPADNQRFPNPLSLPFWPASDATGWIPWPERDEPTDRDPRDLGCPRCYGAGRVTWIEECEPCHGMGSQYDERGDRIGPCPKCNGHGEIYRDPCTYCDGKGTGRLVRYQRVGSKTLCGWMDARIRMLPGPIEYLPDDDPEGPVAFRFAGGEGLAMPILLEGDE